MGLPRANFQPAEVPNEPNVAQRSVASQNDHKSKACLPEASNTAFTMYRRLKRRLRRLYEAPFLAPFFLAPHSSSVYLTMRSTQSVLNYPSYVSLDHSKLCERFLVKTYLYFGLQLSGLALAKVIA